MHTAELSRAPTQLHVIVTSVASDAHTWNLVVLQLVLEELGHRVVNLGSCVPDGVLVAECRTHRPDLVVISSVNGHGFTDGARVIRQLRACPELAGTAVVIGGKLGITGRCEGADRLLDAGFDAVFGDDAGIGRLRSFVGQLPVSVTT